SVMRHPHSCGAPRKAKRRLPAISSGEAAAKEWSGGGALSDGVRGGVLDALVGQQFLQLALLEHLANDVATSHELALDVELRNRGPLREALDALAEAHVFEHVDVLVVDADILKDLRDLAGEAALRHLLRAFHEQDHIVGRNRLAD